MRLPAAATSCRSARRERRHAPPHATPALPLTAPARRSSHAPLLRRANRTPSASSGAPSNTEPQVDAANYRCWTNPRGAVLTELVPGNIWAAERAFMWNGIDVGGRSVVARLSDGSLWVHSPVALDAPLRAALAALGEVRHVVAPNYEHLRYTRQWLDAYPDATGYGCPGLRAKAPQLGLHTDALDARGQPPAEWLGEVRAEWLDFERNPFTARPFFNELLFFHAASRVAVTTDYWWNYPGGADVPLGTRAWKLGMDKIYAPFYSRFMVVDRPKARRVGQRVAEWGVEVLAPCHGGVLRGAAAREALAAQFAACGCGA